MGRTKKTDVTPEVTDDRLNDLCLEWQTRLRLLDWAIVVRFVRGHELDPGTVGDCSPTMTLKRATIRIVTEGDYSGGNEEPYSVENILIHELIHLHVFPFYDPHDWNTPQGIAAEQAIDLIAGALVKAKRGQ